MDGQSVVDKDDSPGAGEADPRPRPRLTASVPTLPSLDFDETVAFYDKLGFGVQSRDIGLLCLMRDGVRLHFWLTGNKRIPQSSSCWIDVEGIDALHAAFAPHKVVHRRGKLETKPWGIREFDVADCHGNLIRFCERVPGARSG
jgi:hypothetical protein